jgi:hypothetical protein
MSNNQTDCRADVSRVVNVLSEPASRPVTAEADERYTPINHAQIERMGKTAAILQEVVWETHKGTYGSSTMLKEVEHETMCCPDCEIPGRYDNHGDVVCPNECGRIISETPLMVPEDSFNGRVEGGPSGSNGGKPALNPAAMSSPEPNVQ